MFGCRVTETSLKFFDFNTLTLQERRTVEFRRISLIGFRSCTSRSHYRSVSKQTTRYIDTRPNGDALRKCILQGPYTPSIVTIPAVHATNDTPAIPERAAVEIILNMSPENKAHYESEKEAIHLLLTRIGNEIYSTIDACKTSHKMWIAIERLEQGESLNLQDVKTNLFWEFDKFNSHDGESMESY
ncbi:hypothetical protein Tco_0635673 [Tanacetum coccineum]